MEPSDDDSDGDDDSGVGAGEEGRGTGAGGRGDGGDGGDGGGGAGSSDAGAATVEPRVTEEQGYGRTSHRTQGAPARSPRGRGLGHSGASESAVLPVLPCPCGPFLLQKYPLVDGPCRRAPRMCTGWYRCSSSLRVMGALVVHLSEPMSYQYSATGCKFAEQRGCTSLS